MARETSPPPVPPATSFAAASAISNHIDTRTAALEVSQRVQEAMSGGVDLLLVFASFHHRSGIADAATLIRSALEARLVLGVTADSILGDDQELEGRSGLSILALRLPGIQLRPISMEPWGQPITIADRPAVRERFGIADDTRAVLLLADPFSTPVPSLISVLTRARDGRPVPIVGGVASGASQPGQNVLVLDNRTAVNGIVGVSISGPVDLDFIVSQGCRPVGRPLVITKGEVNSVEELGGRPAMDTIEEVARELPERERALLKRGLCLGIVIREQQARFGRGDFLIRNVIGHDPKARSFAINDNVRVGKTVQLHVRDAETAAEDLNLLLDAQQLKPPPFASLLFTCNSRGMRLFPDPHHDVRTFRRRLGEVPIAGFFAGGEIGPIGDYSYVHGHTASALLFRAPESS